MSDMIDVAIIGAGELEYKGVYAFINRKFLMENFSDIEFVNRQEDTGNEGLRRAKESYHPADMVKKYLVSLS